MNRKDAKLIAETITYEQLEQMFESAKENITDWTQTSTVNQTMSKGMAWNILYPALSEDMKYRSTGIKNMIWEFGDYLSDELKPTKVTEKELRKYVYHEEPKF